MPTFTTTTKDAEERFDVVVRDHVDLSRSKLQKYIKRGQIKLNGETARAHTPIKPGDEIFYPEHILATDPVKKAPAPDLNILYENADVLVINKPAGLIVHTAPGHEGAATVVDGVLKKYPSVQTVGDDPSRPGIVHRLDKDVSGVMVVTKTQEAFNHLKQQFKNRTIDKEYIALVYGQLEKKTGEITFKIARGKDGHMVARPETQEGKEARTAFAVMERYKTATLLRVKTFTGRTHQIRVHFKAIGHPLVGDTLHTVDLRNIAPIEIDRIFLHASHIGFTLPSGERQTVTSPLPEPLQRILNELPKN